MSLGQLGPAQGPNNDDTLSAKGLEPASIQTQTQSFNPQSDMAALHAKKGQFVFGSLQDQLHKREAFVTELVKPTAHIIVCKIRFMR